VVQFWRWSGRNPGFWITLKFSLILLSIGHKGNRYQTEYGAATWRTTWPWRRSDCFLVASYFSVPFCTNSRLKRLEVQQRKKVALKCHVKVTTCSIITLTYHNSRLEFLTQPILYALSRHCYNYFVTFWALCLLQKKNLISVITLSKKNNERDNLKTSPLVLTPFKDLLLHQAETIVIYHTYIDGWWRGVVGNAFRLKRSYSTPGPVSTAMGDCLRAGKPFRCEACQLSRLSLLPSVGW